MKKIVVIGGGFAGLSAASFLSNSGFKVELLEASPKLGGRAYSFVDKETGAVIDNGHCISSGNPWTCCSGSGTGTCPGTPAY